MENDKYGEGINRVQFSDDVNDGVEQFRAYPVGENMTQSNVINGEEFFSGMTKNERILRLRAQNPFIPIVPLPNSVKTLVLAANVAQECPIPSGSKWFRVKGNADYYVSANGTASVPAASIVGDFETGVMYKPEDAYYYCEEMQSISIVAPANAIVSVQFFFQL